MRSGHPFAESGVAPQPRHHEYRPPPRSDRAAHLRRCRRSVDSGSNGARLKGREPASGRTLLNIECIATADSNKDCVPLHVMVWLTILALFEASLQDALHMALELTSVADPILIPRVQRLHLR